ncbi:MAG TPA: hypothetical protein VF062_11410 [Candidatus Limnocylindrales bacterium]
MNRRWLPWRPRLLSKRAGDGANDGLVAADILDTFDVPFLGGLIFIISVAVICVLAVILVAEWFVALALIPVLVLIRLVGLFPWIIVARRWSGTHVMATYYGEVAGWRPAWRLVRTVKQEIRDHGTPHALRWSAISPHRG